jgi:hypothetical protein
MESLKADDWVRTPSGHEGKIILVHRMSAFIEYGSGPSGSSTCLLSELTKIDPPSEPPSNPPSVR